MKRLLLRHSLNREVAACNLRLRVNDLGGLEDALGLQLHCALRPHVGRNSQPLIGADVVAKLARRLSLLHEIPQGSALCVRQQPEALPQKLRVAALGLVLLTRSGVVQRRFVHDSLQGARLPGRLSVRKAQGGNYALWRAVAFELVDHSLLFRASWLLYEHPLEHRVWFAGRLRILFVVWLRGLAHPSVQR